MAFADAQIGGKILDGQIPIEIELAESVVRGDALGYSSGWKRALATVGTAIQAKAVAGMDGLAGDRIIAYFGKTRVGGRFSDCTVGGAVYVAEGTDNGKWTQTAPSTAGDCTKVCGVAVAADEILFDPNAEPDTVAGAGT